MVPCSGWTRSSHRWALPASTALVYHRSSTHIPAALLPIQMLKHQSHRKTQAFISDNKERHTINQTIRAPFSLLSGLSHHMYSTFFSTISCLRFTIILGPVHSFVSVFPADSHMVLTVDFRGRKDKCFFFIIHSDVMTLLSGVVFYLIKKIEMFVSQVEAMEQFQLGHLLHVSKHF